MGVVMAFNMYVRTSVSRNMAEARHKVIDLYRKACRLVPVLIAQYELSFTPAAMRARIRKDFDKHRDVSNPQVVDKLLFLGMVDIEEGRNMWKQTNHVDSYFAETADYVGLGDAAPQERPENAEVIEPESEEKIELTEEEKLKLQKTFENFARRSKKRKLQANRQYKE